MSLGFDALKEMNDSIQRNRNLLKGNKKSKFDRDADRGTYKIGNQSLADTVRATPEELDQVRRAAQLERRMDITKRLVALAIISVVVIGSVEVSVIFG